MGRKASHSCANKPAAPRQAPAAKPHRQSRRRRLTRARATSASPLDTAAEARRILAERELERRACKEDLTLLLDRMSMVDEKTGDVFRFHLNDPTSGWYWQRTDVWDVLESEQVIAALQGAAARHHLALRRPAARPRADRARHPAPRLPAARRGRDRDRRPAVGLLRSLPPHLRFGVKVLKPHRGLERDDVRPEGEIELLHPDGRLVDQGAAADRRAPAAARPSRRPLRRGRVHRPAARGPEGVMATVGKIGEVYLVSTANGVSGEDGEGNYFHWLWKNADEAGIAASSSALQAPRPRRPLVRDRARVPDPRRAGPRRRVPAHPRGGLPAHRRRGYFDRDALAYYADARAHKPLYRFEFEQVGPSAAKRSAATGR
jgi:hypothetical protein